ncbi:MAG: metallopeptidase family protein [Dehalococcoidia bacterium]|nr:MAG: metallopeptidase family protein [Dehalococcoidia bacterium]
MQKTRFEALVVKAVKELPSEFQDRLENVDIVVENYPTSGNLDSRRVGEKGNLLGLYEGVPQAKRGRHYGLVVPDKITIFQKPIEAIAYTDAAIEREIKKVVRHEIAHHFGSSEETLRKLESD